VREFRGEKGGGMRYVTQEEIDAAIKQTKTDLFELVKEIGQEQVFEIIDEYLPEEDDQPPYILFESLFGKIDHDNFDQFILSEEYLLGVWKRCKTRLNLIIDGSQRKQGLQSKWLRVKRAAFERDGYKCQICGSQKDLCGHHVKEKAQYPELAYEVSNIITLCKHCHAKQHPGKEKLILRKRGQQ
jgi:hypothetical protein